MLVAECIEVMWTVGKSIAVSDWSGGFNKLVDDYHCNQPDSFPPPVRNPSCPYNQVDGQVGEAFVENKSHSGKNSLIYVSYCACMADLYCLIYYG